MVERLIECFCRKGVGSLRFEGRACWITGDPIMLRRAISNLLSNTMRYTPPGKTITLRIKEADDQIHIIVENPGTPIAPEHLPRLFDRFYRVDPSRQRKGEGSGIGLAIVKSIVIAHQGKVSVTSDTRYSFYFDITQTPPLNCSDSERRYH